MSVLMCVECALKHNCEPIEGHISSVHKGTCNFCGLKDKEVRSTWDWKWPYVEGSKR